MIQRRVLIVGEFTKLVTGYATYLNHLMTELHKREDLQIAQFAMYCSEVNHAPLIKEIPWKVFGNLPTNDQEARMYESHPTNEFGGWRFDQVCLEFMPHVVISIADPWMISCITESPFRKFYKIIYMCPADGEPSQDEFFGTYKEVDYLLTYQDWSLNFLKREGFDLLNLQGSAPPQVDTNAYKLITNKKQHKQNFIAQVRSLNIDLPLNPDSFIIGMVARNQKRKLFPELVESVNELLRRLDEETGKNVLLYWHTAYPDLGWNIPALIKEGGLSRKIMFTYFCGGRPGSNEQGCGYYTPSFYRDVTAICPRCHKHSLSFSNSNFGLNREQLGTIYGLFDLYVQYTTLAGFEIPITEAAACGTYVMGTDSTGLADNVRKLGGYSIPVTKWILEAETRRNYPVPDNEALIKEIKKFIDLPEAVRLNMGMKCYSNCMKYYGDWAQTAIVWESCIDQVQVNDEVWASPPELVQIPPGFPDETQCGDEQFISWLLTEVMRRPEWVNGYTGLKLLRDLQWARANKGNLGVFAGDLSNIGGRCQYEMVGRNQVFGLIRQLREKFNQSEMARFQRVQQRMGNG